MDDDTITDLLDLSGHQALVTGGGKGIGEAIAARLTQAGASVTIADMDPDAAATAERLGANFVGCDITDNNQLVAAFDAATTDGPLHILINNAGIFPTTGPMQDAADEFVARMLDVNVRAQFSACREGATRMTEGGSIINMASVAGLGGSTGISAYGASKAAMISLTQGFSRELGPLGIRVNAIAPGIIDTPGVRAQMEPLLAAGLDIESLISANPLQTTGQPDHIARCALYLCSELASFVTGQVHVVDGGSRA